jgi:hypothetical protein
MRTWRKSCPQSIKYTDFAEDSEEKGSGAGEENHDLAGPPLPPVRSVTATPAAQLTHDYSGG